MGKSAVAWMLFLPPWDLLQIQLSGCSEVRWIPAGLHSAEGPCSGEPGWNVTGECCRGTR